MGAGRAAVVELPSADAAGASGSVGGTSAAAAGATGSAGAGADSTEGALVGRGAGRGASTAGASSVMAGPAAATTGTSAGSVDAASAAVAFFAGAFLAAFLAALASAAVFQASPCVSSRRRATGASTVEDADLTNSPMSLSAARTSLLGTPNSLASSWTLALATILLRGRSEPTKVQTVRCWACSSHESHRDVMSSCSTLFVGLSPFGPSPCPRVGPGAVRMLQMLRVLRAFRCAPRARSGQRCNRPVPRGARPEGWRDVVRPVRGMRAWGAGVLPGPLFFLQRPVRRRGWPRRPRRRRAGGQTSPRVPDSPRRCGLGTPDSSEPSLPVWTAMPRTRHP